MSPIYEYTYRRNKVAETPGAIRAPGDLTHLFPSLFDGLENEELKVLALDTKNQVIGVETVYRGNVAGSSVRVGEVFRFAVRHNAAAILVAHNHPSGDPAPSSADIHVTTEMVEAGRLLDIEVLDHIIVGDRDRTVSLRAIGVLGRGGTA